VKTERLEGASFCPPYTGSWSSYFCLSANQKIHLTTSFCNAERDFAGVRFLPGAASNAALQDFGTGATAQGINDQGQIVGIVGSADNTTEYAALWQDGVLTNLGTLPGDFAAIGTGINNRGQIVGSTLDSGFSWAHAFIYQDGKMASAGSIPRSRRNSNGRRAA